MSDSIQPTTIPFTQIPQPPYQTPGTYVEVQPSYAQVGLLPWPANALIMGQMLSTGSAVANKVYAVTRLADATALFGSGSQLEAMARRFLAANGFIPLNMAALADAAGATKATGNFAITGTWTASGTLPLYLHGVYVPVAIGVGDTAATVAANAVAAINDFANPVLQVTAAQGTSGQNNEIILTARHGGLIGNNIALEVAAGPGDALPAGMIVTVTAMSGGATNPTIATIIDAITGVWFTDIVIGWQDNANLSALTAELANRYNAMEGLDAHAYTCVTGSYSQQLAAQTGLNSPWLSAIGMVAPPSPPWEIAASLGAVASLNLTNDPARQLRGLALPGIVGDRAANRLTAEEKELELEGGICPFDTDADGTVVLKRVPTTYLTNSQGVADPAWHDIMVPKVMSRVRYDWKTYTALLYPRNKLADDGSVASEYDSSVVTPSRMKASWAARETLYEQSGWLENGAVLNRQAVFARDANDRNRMDCSIPVQIIGNLMVLATLLQFEV